MKKVLFGLVLTLLLLNVQPVLAKNVKVVAIDGFDSQNPPQTMRVKVISDAAFDNGTNWLQGYILTGKIVNVQDPKRLKQNATFSFVAESYTTFQGETHPIKEEMVAKYSAGINTGELTKSAVLAVGDHFLKGVIGPGVAAVEGAVKNKEGNRAKSAAVSVYESTPLSYIEKGESLVIMKDQEFYLSFKEKKDEAVVTPSDNNSLPTSNINPEQLNHGIYKNINSGAGRTDRENNINKIDEYKIQKPNNSPLYSNGLNNTMDNTTGIDNVMLQQSP